MIYDCQRTDNINFLKWGKIMNRKRTAYDKIAVGERIRKKRTYFNISQEEIAQKIDRATKYYSDIERGTCGMSLETMISIASALDMSLDYMLLGIPSESDERVEIDELAIMQIMSTLTKKQREYAIRLLKTYAMGVNCENISQLEISANN